MGRSGFAHDKPVNEERHQILPTRKHLLAGLIEARGDVVAKLLHATSYSLDGLPGLRIDARRGPESCKAGWEEARQGRRCSIIDSSSHLIQFSFKGGERTKETI